MRVDGKRIKRTRYFEGDRFVAAVDVELVLPPDDPSEPCYETETLQFLREVRERVARGDVTWLKQRGRVYVATEVE